MAHVDDASRQQVSHGTEADLELSSQLVPCLLIQAAIARLDALENDQGGDAFGADDNDEEVVLDSEGDGECTWPLTQDQLLIPLLVSH